MRNAAERCKAEQITYPPNLPKFLALCTEAEDDTEEAFWRMIRQEPCQSQAEKITRQRVGFACQTRLSEEAARKKFKVEYAENKRRYSRGELPDEDVMMIEQKAPLSDLDREVQNRAVRQHDKTPQEMIADVKRRLRIAQGAVKVSDK